MSDFLLQKSCKLLQESKCGKKTKESDKIRLRKKKNCMVLKQFEKEKFKNNILKNLQKLEKLNKESAVDLSEKTIAKGNKNCDKDKHTEEKEATVFTEQDFEDFEKEYSGD